MSTGRPAPRRLSSVGRSSALRAARHDADLVYRVSWRHLRMMLLELCHLSGPTLHSASGPDPERQPSDAERDFRLVRAFLARDPEATAQVADRLQIIPRILGGLCRRFRFPMNLDELADVGQDACAVALRKLDQLPPNVPLDAWLHRLCSYELSNALRRKSRTRAEQLPDELASPEARMVDLIERREMVFLALDRLGPDETAVVRLHHLEGLTFAEIAVRLGVTQNTVKGRYYRGVAELGVILRRHHPTRNEP